MHEYANATISSETCCVPCEVRQEACFAEMLNEVAPNGLRNTRPVEHHNPELAVCHGENTGRLTVGTLALACRNQAATSQWSSLRTITNSDHHKNAT